MNAFRLFQSSLQRAGSRAALVAGMQGDRCALSYRSLGVRVNRIAGQLVEAGVQPGDRVLLAIPMSIETYIVMLALLKKGMVIMFIDPAHGARKVGAILREWPPDAVVASQALLLFRFLLPELRRIPRRFVSGGYSRGATGLLSERGEEDHSDVSRSAADAALLTFTSGSTGDPKPVVRTHGFLVEQMKMLDRVAVPQTGDVDFVAMPMFVLFNLAHAVTSVIPACDVRNPGKASPRLIYQQLRQEGATRMLASPALLERLAAYALRRGLDLPDMHCISTGGGPVSPQLPAQLKKIAPDAVIRTVYGSTEAEPIAVIDDAEISLTATRQMRAGRGLIVGKPVAGCSVRIMRSCPAGPCGPLNRAQFAGLALPDGEIGEIVVAGRHVLSGYADPARDRDSKIEVDGEIWHRTGDAGCFDNSGRLWLAGRNAAAIRDSRGVVYPFQVEYALSGTPGVRRAALIARHGRRVLVLETIGRRFRSDCASAARCIAEHQVDSIVTVRRIPMDRRHNAKVDYIALERILEGRMANMRLWLIQTISTSWRYCRRGLRSILYSCKFRKTATKVRR